MIETLVAIDNVRADELPPDVRAKADEREGFYPSYVDWPIAQD